MPSWLTYLLQVSICHGLFYLLYLGLFRNLSFFQTNRIYLLAAVMLGFIIPVLQIPFWENSTVAILNMPSILSTPSNNTVPNVSSTETIWSTNLIFFGYMIGFTLHLWRLARALVKINSLIREHESDEYHGVRTVHLNSGPAVFVFLSRVFINKSKMNISPEEFRQVIDHEKHHVTQRHTLDNILLELAIIICWFNPILRLIKRELNNVHEFYADQIVTQATQDLDGYSRLILRLSRNQKDHIPLTHQFSMYNIKTRIIMLNKQKNNKSYLVRYALAIPCLLVLLALFSFEEKRPKENKTTLSAQAPIVINKITWNGNTRYSSEFLSKFMGIGKGVEFNEDAINQKLNYRPEGGDLGSLFLDQGYLFFSVEMKKEVHSGTVDLVFNLNEGEIITIKTITVTGNKKVDSRKILSMISLESGEPFSRSKLMASQRKIAESGLLDPDAIAPNLIPNPGEKTVDIEFNVKEL